MTNAILKGKSDAGNQHARYEVGKFTSVKPRRGALLYKKILIVAISLSCLSVYATPFLTEAKVLRMGKSGRLMNTNRYSYATFSRCNVFFARKDGKAVLPCRFVFQSKSGCGQFDFSSVCTESKLMTKCDSCEILTNDLMLGCETLLPMPKHMRIGLLDMEIKEYPFDVDIIVKESNSDMGVLPDQLLYKRFPENYFRYFQSSDSNVGFGNVRWQGKCIDYRIYPADQSEDIFCVEDMIQDSEYFTRMRLKYKKEGQDFRLKEIILWGKCDYSGAPLYSDPTSLEVRKLFVRSSSRVLNGKGENGIVETGCGVLEFGISMQYNVFRLEGDERIKVEIAVRDEDVCM